MDVLLQEDPDARPKRLVLLAVSGIAVATVFATTAAFVASAGQPADDSPDFTLKPTETSRPATTSYLPVEPLPMPPPSETSLAPPTTTVVTTTTTTRKPTTSPSAPPLPPPPHTPEPTTKPPVTTTRPKPPPTETTDPPTTEPTDPSGTPEDGIAQSEVAPL